MAKGYPDFFGMPIFPQYGTFNALQIPFGAVASGVTATLWEITGKCRLYGGSLRCDVATNEPANSKFTVTIDDVSHDCDIWRNMTKFNSGYIGARFVDIRRFDLVDGIFSFKVPGEIIFGLNYKLELVNASAGDIGPSGYLYYTEIL